ncbi:hypothetical protein ERHA54_36510 [Erwinia rhapontici]|nr:hypothetical protein ERHA54_36510 [Erwinia rhapontici]
MRSVVSYVLIAAVAGFVGASFTKAPELIDKISNRVAPVSDPEGFWSTPAIEGYGKMHYESDVAYKPNINDSNKIVFQITRAENAPQDPNLGLERVARVVNLYVASGVPTEKLKFVVSVTGEGTPAMLNNEQYHRIYGIDNPNLKLIGALRAKGWMCPCAISLWPSIISKATGLIGRLPMHSLAQQPYRPLKIKDMLSCRCRRLFRAGPRPAWPRFSSPSLHCCAA